VGEPISGELWEYALAWRNSAPKGAAMTVSPLPHPDAPYDFAQAVILASDAAVLMLDEQLRILVASRSFCHAFQINPAHVTGRLISFLGSGEWDSPQLDAMLAATAAGLTEVNGYEMRLLRFDRPVRTLVINAHRIDHPDKNNVRVLMSVLDVTDIRAMHAQKEELIREKASLQQELQHRVANSLQIIASILMQNAKAMLLDGSQLPFRDASSHSKATSELQQQLSLRTGADTALSPYLTNLIRVIGASLIHDRDTVSIKVDVDDSVVAGAMATSIGLLVAELVINALKHAFPSARGGTVSVSYRSDGEGWTLVVRDDGVGMLNAWQDAKAGLGTSIVRA